MQKIIPCPSPKRLFIVKQMEIFTETTTSQNAQENMTEWCAYV